MWSNKSLTIHAIFLISFWGCTFARAETRCPPTINGHYIKNIELLDDLPNNGSPQIPEGGVWNVAKYRINKIDKYRIFYLCCIYSKSNDFVIIKIPMSVTVCTVSTGPNIICN